MATWFVNFFYSTQCSRYFLRPVYSFDRTYISSLLLGSGVLLTLHHAQKN